MDVRFVAQPFADGFTLNDFMGEVASDKSLDNLDVVVAWAKRSGLSRLRQDLEEIRARTGSLRLIVGISEGGATKQGLELARELFDSVHVFHDRGSRTFHPKIYVAWGATAARILVGSHNITAGGAYKNYEAGLDCTLDLPGDAEFLNEIMKYIERLYADVALCKELTDPTLAELIGNPRYRVGDEDDHSHGGKSGTDADDDVDVESETDPPGASIFGSSAEAKKPDPGTGATRVRTVAKKAATTKKASPIPGGTGGSGMVARPAVVKRWFKPLSRADAQHPASSKTNPTGALRLVQAGLPIDQTTYFRSNFFASLPWSSTPKRLGIVEDAVASFDTVINGVSLGNQNLRLDYAAYKEAGQGNFTTVLHWGVLGSRLQTTDHTGQFVILEQLSDGSYRLGISPTGPGAAAFIP